MARDSGHLRPSVSGLFNCLCIRSSVMTSVKETMIHYIRRRVGCEKIIRPTGVYTSIQYTGKHFPVDKKITTTKNCQLLVLLILFKC